MRRIISFILIVCLLQTQTYHAAGGIIEEQTGSSVWEKGVSKVAFWRTSDSKKTMDLTQLESGGVTLDVKGTSAFSDLATSLKQHASALKERMSAFVRTPMGFTAVFLAGAVLVFYSIYLYVTGFVSWFEGIPFDVASKMVTHSFLSSYQPLDVCQNFLGTGKDLERTRWFSHYDHASGYNGVSFADALPLWVNNATNLMTMLSSAVLAERAVGYGYNQNSNEFATQFKKFLFVNAATMQRNYSCTFKLGESDHLDAITECQEDVQRDLHNSIAQVPEASDALIQFRRWDNKYGLKAPEGLIVRLSINRNHLNTQRYPQLDYSLDHAHIDNAARMSTQRHLMQLGNQLTLPEAVADRISNNLQAMTQLNDMLSKLRLWESVSHADNLALTTLVRSIFDANQIALTSDVGCDFDLESGIFKMLSCFQGSAWDIPNGAPIPDDGQVWFVRTVGNGLIHASLIASKIPVAEAIATWLKQSTVAMQNLWGVADSLHHRVCNGTSDGQLDLFRNVAQEELIDHKVALSSDIGCDLRFNDAGIEEIVCHSGTAPQLKVDGCDLDSNVPVRWEGKLWLKPHSINAGWVDRVIVATTPLWQASRSQMRPYSPSLKITDSVLPIDSDSASNELSLKITPSNSDSLSAEMSDDVTSSGSGSSSNEMSDEVSDSLSRGSPSHSPTLPNANTTGNGITELYYVNVIQEVRKAFLNATHILNDTGFLSQTSFGSAGSPVYGVYVDTEFQKIYWSTLATANNQDKNIYVADIESNPTQLNNTRLIYTSSTRIYSVYLSKEASRVFWISGISSIYMGKINITNPTNITNVTSQLITPGTYNPRGLYYDSNTQALLWAGGEGSPARYFIYKSTLNLQTEQLMNTTVLWSESSPINAVSYDVKNHRIFFACYDYTSSKGWVSVALFNFENPWPLTNVRNISGVNYLHAISVVND